MIYALVLIVLIFVNIPLYKRIFRLFFQSYEDFQEAFRYAATPDLISLIKGRFWKDQVSESRLSGFFFLCIAAVGLEFWMVYVVLHALSM